MDPGVSGGLAQGGKSVLGLSPSSIIDGRAYILQTHVDGSSTRCLTQRDGFATPTAGRGGPTTSLTRGSVVGRRVGGT